MSINLTGPVNGPTPAFTGNGAAGAAGAASSLVPGLNLPGIGAIPGLAATGGNATTTGEPGAAAAPAGGLLESRCLGVGDLLGGSKKKKDAAAPAEAAPAAAEPGAVAPAQEMAPLRPHLPGRAGRSRTGRSRTGRGAGAAAPADAALRKQRQRKPHLPRQRPQKAGTSRRAAPRRRPAR